MSRGIDAASTVFGIFLSSAIAKKQVIVIESFFDLFLLSGSVFIVFCFADFLNKKLFGDL